jgi:hypothetical protein
MSADGKPEPAVGELLESCPPHVRALALQARDAIRAAVPDATEEVDASARLIGYTFAPGTYKGLVAAIALQRDYVNIMFSRGAELADTDASGLLEGTGKRARHVKVRTSAVLDDPGLTTLLTTAAARTPR